MARASALRRPSSCLFRYPPRACGRYRRPPARHTFRPLCGCEEFGFHVCTQRWGRGGTRLVTDQCGSAKVRSLLAGAKARPCQTLRPFPVPRCLLARGTAVAGAQIRLLSLHSVCKECTARAQHAPRSSRRAAARARQAWRCGRVSPPPHLCQVLSRLQPFIYKYREARCCGATSMRETMWNPRRKYEKLCIVFHARDSDFP